MPNGFLCWGIVELNGLIFSPIFLQEMSKLRYNCELLKHENKDLKRTAGTTSRLLTKHRHDLDQAENQLRKCEAKLSTSENANMRRLKSRNAKVGARNLNNINVQQWTH